MHRFLNPAIIVLTALALAAAQPMLSLAQFFYSDDSLLHLFRTFALDRAIQQGILFPRWLPDLAYGYSYPLFNYYPPLSAYVIETLHLLGLGFATAVKWTFVLSIAIAAFGAYAMGNELFNQRSFGRTIGILTAVAYVFFPYFLTDIYFRGAIAETLAAALVPWLFWSMRRLLTRPALGTFLLCAIFIALLLLAHSPTLFMVAPVLAFYVLIELGRLSAGRLTAALVIGGAGLVGLFLGAFYWLPFILELPLVKLGQGIEAISIYFTVGYHFQSASNLIQSAWLYQYGGRTLGLVSIALGVLASVCAFIARRDLKERAMVFYFGGVVGVSALAMLDVSMPIWRAIPFATMVQYPWRVSILIGLGLAIVISSLPITFSMVVLKTVARFRITLSNRIIDATHILVAFTLACAILVASRGALRWQEVGVALDEPALAQLARFEAITGFIGTTTWGEYLPTTVKNLEPVDMPVQPATLSADAEIQIVRYSATEREFLISTSQPISFSMRTLYFPDWHARIDDQSAFVYPSFSTGALAVDVPAGNHRVVFSQSATLPQQIGNIVSIISVIIGLTLSAVAIRRHFPEARILAGTLGILSVIVILPAMTATLAQPATIQPLHEEIAPELVAAGIVVEQAQLESNVWRISDPQRELNLSVYWQVRQAVADKTFRWRLIDGEGNVRATREQFARYGSGFPTTWAANSIVEDHYSLPIIAVMPGQYVLQVAFANGNYVSVGQVDLARGGAPPLKEPQIANAIDAQMGDAVRLIGYEFARVIPQDDYLPITLYWRTDRDIPIDYTALFVLIDANNKVESYPYYDGTQFIGLYPTSLWVPREVVIDQQFLRLPPAIKPGVYQLAVGLRRLSDSERMPVVVNDEFLQNDVVVLGEIKVPMDLTDVKPVHAENFQFGSDIRMLGYTLTTQDKPGNLIAPSIGGTPPRLSATRDQWLALNLYWRANIKISTDYKVFMHIVNEEGQVILQQDQSPGEWRYPTRIWDAGESIADLHRLAVKSLPAGLYKIRIGLYDSSSGERLPIMDANGHRLLDDQIEIGWLTVNP